MHARVDHDHRWRLLLVIIAVALTVYVAIDVRARGRTAPLPPEEAALVDPADPRPFPFGRSTSIHKTDLTAYTAAARVFADGCSAEDAYAARSPRGWRYQYLPLLAALLTPIAGLATTTQSVLFGLLTVAVIILLLDESRRWWRLLASPSDAPRISIPAFIAIMAVAACAFPILNTLQRGQVGLLVVWPLMIGFRLLVTARQPWLVILGGVALAFPAILKLIPLMPAGAALLMALTFRTRLSQRERPLVRGSFGIAGFALGVALFGFALPALLIGSDRTIDGSRVFYEGVATNPDFSQEWDFEIHSNRNQSLDSALWKLRRVLTGGERIAADPLGLSASTPHAAPIGGALALASTLFRAAVTLAALITAVVVARRGTRAAFAGFGVICLATLVVSPVSWGHHFVLLAPCMLAIPIWLEARGRSGAAFAFSITLTASVLLHYSAIDVLGAVGLLGFASTLLVMAVMIMLWRDRAHPSHLPYPSLPPPSFDSGRTPQSIA